MCLSRLHVRSADHLGVRPQDPSEHRAVYKTATADSWSDRIAAVDVLEAFKGAVYRRDFFDLDRLKRVPHSCRRTRPHPNLSCPRWHSRMMLAMLLCVNCDGFVNTARLHTGTPMSIEHLSAPVGGVRCEWRVNAVLWSFRC